MMWRDVKAGLIAKAELHGFNANVDVTGSGISVTVSKHGGSASRVIPIPADHICNSYGAYLSVKYAVYRMLGAALRAREELIAVESAKLVMEAA